jgi:hypothetical protein
MCPYKNTAQRNTLRLVLYGEVFNKLLIIGLINIIVFVGNIIIITTVIVIIMIVIMAALPP